MKIILNITFLLVLMMPCFLFSKTPCTDLKKDINPAQLDVFKENIIRQLSTIIDIKKMEVLDLIYSK